MANGRGKDTKRAGWVYFIRCPANGLIKIGFTADEPRNRLIRLQATCPVPLEPMGLIVGGIKVERKLHERFDAAWDHGEWFRPVPELIAFIEAEVKPWEVERTTRSRRAFGMPRKQTVEEWANVAVLTYKGETRTVLEWAKLWGVYPQTIKTRMVRDGVDSFDQLPLTWAVRV